MIDRENVIDNLEQNIRWIEEIECHQFPGWGNVTIAMRDAVELLKEQEPIQMKVLEDYVSIKIGECPKCKSFINNRTYPKSCGCGQKVKWDDK